jgi:hypothetical protein
LPFCGRFCEIRVLDVVIWWCSCGGMRGKGGQKTTTFSGLFRSDLLVRTFVRFFLGLPGEYEGDVVGLLFGTDPGV